MTELKPVGIEAIIWQRTVSEPLKTAGNISFSVQFLSLISTYTLNLAIYKQYKLTALR